MKLADEVVRLREFRDDDAPTVARACDDPDAARFLAGLPSPYTLDDAKEHIANTRVWRASGERRAFAIADSETDALVGAINVHFGAKSSIGYWVAPWVRGRGVATRAVVLLSRWALTEGGVERLELTTHPENAASRRVAEKAGFTHEGLVPDYLETALGPRDSIVFSLRGA